MKKNYPIVCLFGVLNKWLLYSSGFLHSKCSAFQSLPSLFSSQNICSAHSSQQLASHNLEICMTAQSSFQDWRHLYATFQTILYDILLITCLAIIAASTAQTDQFLPSSETMTSTWAPIPGPKFEKYLQAESRANVELTF